MAKIEKNSKREIRINDEINRYATQFIDFKLPHEDNALQYLVFAVSQNKSGKELFDEQVKVNNKYCIEDCPGLTFFAWLFDIAKISPMTKDQFWSENELTGKLYRPNLFEFIKTFNTGTYVVVSNLNESKHHQDFSVIHNGKILRNRYLSMINTASDLEIDDKLELIKELRAYFNGKIADVVQINTHNMNPDLVIF